jgi:cysteinyl-tRNA synthetase
VDGKKMSKSEGNFYTLRDLLLKGYKASAIRLALILGAVPASVELYLRGLTRRPTPSTGCGLLWRG